MVLRWSPHIDKMDPEEEERMNSSSGSKQNKSSSSSLVERIPSLQTGKMENMDNLDKLWPKYLMSFYSVKMTYNSLHSRYILYYITRTWAHILLNIS